MNTQQPAALKRTLKPHWVFAIALGSAVGWGAFILPFDWMVSGGLGGTLAGFAIGGLMITVIALSYGAVVRALPVTGGGVAFALAALGRTHAFVAGWCLTLGYAGIVALNASATALVFRVTVPDLVMHVKLYTIAGWDVYLPEVLISTAILLIFAWINARGIELSGRFQFIAVVLMLVAVAFILAATVIKFVVDQPTLAPAIPEGVSPWVAIATIVAFVPWAYVGFDNVPQLAGEFDFTPKKALQLLMWGVAAATFIYMAMMVATSLAVGDRHVAYESSAWPTTLAITDMIGPIGLILMVIAVSMGVLTGLNGFYVSTSRVLLTMGRAKMLPRQFASVSSTQGSPTVGIVFTLLICLATPWFGRAALGWVVDMTSVGITVAYFYTCYCSFVIGRRGYVTGMADRQAPSKGQAVIGLAGCVLAVGFLSLLLVPGSPGALGPESLTALIVWLIAGVGFYFLRRRAYMSVPDDEIRKAVFQ
ncbi:APC family permease [Gulosibacter faecalis]|uniref:APC family permease n=1 Tax=Gulosibacter faecalis TaxID=272240 RepID=A0ABW5V3Z4_9MICO|nr:APC family permease [Gulosibacter faecalis]